jgi:hypothetical protein
MSSHFISIFRQEILSISKMIYRSALLFVTLIGRNPESDVTHHLHQGVVLQSTQLTMHGIKRKLNKFKDMVCMPIEPDENTRFSCDEDSCEKPQDKM